ncbi:MAG: THUMP domain-containing class I SAM-dependent RNA methyltransferase [Patescibacteria group bacterium]
MNIFVVIRENTALILLNTSGEALHKRGYRREAGDAPIKETLAAAIIMVSNWRYKSPFLDPFCGSGTIAIEAALMARNIAPGLKRSFAFESWDWYDKKYKLDETTAAMARIYPSGEYQIEASDIDPDMVEIAMENARRAGIPNDVTFRNADVRSYADSKRTGCLVTNPPYGLRLNDQDLVPLYDTLTKIFKANKELAGGIITSWDLFLDRAKREGFEKRKLYNGSERCDFCYKKA